MSALPEQPRDYADETPIIVHKSAPGYVDYLVEKIRAYRDHTNYLHEQIEYKKNDLYAAWTAAAVELIVIGIILYQWLIVCDGAAPG